MLGEEQKLCMRNAHAELAPASKEAVAAGVCVGERVQGLPKLRGCSQPFPQSQQVPLLYQWGR